jgi:multidrug efflux pump subunit AcrA (membrane-fusion protein)
MRRVFGWLVAWLIGIGLIGMAGGGLGCVVAAAEESSSPSGAESSAESSEAGGKSGDGSEETRDAPDKSTAKASPAGEEGDASKPAKKPALHRVGRKDLKVQATLDGVIAAEESEVVAVRPEVWTTFRVVKAVPHGTQVHQGDVLVEFDDEKLEEALAKAEIDQRLGELALMQAEQEFPRIEKSVELSYEEAEREYRMVQEEFERFKKVMRPLSIKMADYNLKSMKQQLANAQEELDQLRKMYEADELTEETEEIVLKRQEFQVEMLTFYVSYYEVNHDYTLNVSIPRREESLTTAVEQGRLAFERAKMVRSLGQSEKRYELEKLREARARSVQSHARLLADRELMTLRAPCDGYAYYGQSKNGRWGEITSLESKLVPYGTISPNTVVMTIVKKRPIYVTTTVSEKDFPAFRQGMSARVKLVADEDVELEGRVRELAAIPSASNKFLLDIDIDADKAPEWLVPGMTCKARLTIYEAEDAVVIPADLVQSDEDDPEQKYVMVVPAEDKDPIRRDLKLGKKQGKNVEVLKGLQAGDQVAKGAKDKAKGQDSD